MHQTIHQSSLDRHVHSEPYAALVLLGGYEEAGDNGRFRVAPGNVVFHDAFDAHLNRFFARGATVLNFPLARDDHYQPGIAIVPDPDSVIRAAETNTRAASGLLFSVVQAADVSQPSDWPDELAQSLLQCPSLKLSEWAEKKGLAPWTISRGFAQIFGISPEAFRARARARHALRLIRQTHQPLAIIAADLGFADQAHMTRSVKQLTGAAPNLWRSRANGFKTGSHCKD